MTMGTNALCVSCWTDEMARAAVSATRPKPPDEPVPFTAGQRYVPDYYKPVNANPRIDPGADVSDVIYAWGVTSHQIGEALAKLLRRKGERKLDLIKVMEHVQRELDFLEMREGEPT